MSVSLSNLNSFHPQASVDNEVITNSNITSDKENQTLTSPSTVVNLSQEGKELANQNTTKQNLADNDNPDETIEGTTDETVTDTDETEESIESEDTKEELTDEEQDELEYLKDRDLEVKIHEQAHASVGGQYAGSPSYTYEQGPDGKSYAVAGEVPIDVSPIAGDPQATISKMEQVYRAALAPVEPSSADKSIATDAQSKISEAKAELVQSQLSGSTPSQSGTTGGEESDQEEPIQSNRTTASNDSRIASYNLSPNTLGSTISQAV